MKNFKKSFAFTMAEILISLTIIGIIAAITLPSLVGNFQQRTFDAKRKALHSRLAQALATLDDISAVPDLYNGDNEYLDQKDYLLTYGIGEALSIKKFEADLPSVAYDMNGNKTSIADCDSSILPFAGVCSAFQTVNGDNVFFWYNRNCASNKNNLLASMCFNFVYDLNGKKGPNTVGKDIGFMSAFYADRLMLVAPMPLYYDGGTLGGSSDYNISTCTGDSSDYDQCMKQQDAYFGTIPTAEEVMSIKANDGLVGVSLWNKSLLTGTRGSKSYSGSYVLEYVHDGDRYAQELKFTSEPPKFITVTTDGNGPKTGLRNPNGLGFGDDDDESEDNAAQ